MSSSGVQCSCRYDWYQTESQVVITILKRGLSIEQCSVELSDSVLTIRAAGEPILTAHLLHTTDEKRVSLTCTPSKVEVKLPKLVGERWSSLCKQSEAEPAAASSKPKTNWNELEKEAEKLDEEEQDALQKFFKTLYKDADEDTRRAMMKSYSESCGTVLSTNWKEIKEKKTEVKPPEGMEYRPTTS
ncbi:SGS domain-containing protein [Aphelenchoides avenae]|nr:SGS domain-containing protein [Aphelenchus avenae]